MSITFENIKANTFFLLLFLLLSLSSNGQKQLKIVSITDYGAIANSGKDAATAITKTIEACKK